MSIFFKEIIVVRIKSWNLSWKKIACERTLHNFNIYWILLAFAVSEINGEIKISSTQLSCFVIRWAKEADIVSHATQVGWQGTHIARSCLTEQCTNKIQMKKEEKKRSRLIHEKREKYRYFG